MVSLHSLRSRSCISCACVTSQFYHIVLTLDFWCTCTLSISVEFFLHCPCKEYVQGWRIAPKPFYHGSHADTGHAARTHGAYPRRASNPIAWKELERSAKACWSLQHGFRLGTDAELCCHSCGHFLNQHKIIQNPSHPFLASSTLASCSVQHQQASKTAESAHASPVSRQRCLLAVKRCARSRAPTQSSCCSKCG